MAELIDSFMPGLQEHYIYPDKVPAIALLVKQNVTKSTIKNFEALHQLCRQIKADFREVINDCISNS